MADVLTPPEHSTERALAKRLRAKVTAAGGCAYCTHRVEGWGRAACSTTGRTFPLCMKTPGTEFEPDHQRLTGEPA
jgi:hypothetical protein